MRLLYELVKEDPMITADSASIQIYGCYSSDKRFIMLKRNLTNRLIELILLAENKGHGKDYQKVMFECNQKIAVANKLLLVDSVSSAEYMMLKAMKKAKEYFLVGVQIQCAVVLRKVYEIKGSPGQVSKFQSLISNLAQETEAIEEGRGYSELINSVVKYSRSQTVKIGKESLKYSIALGKSYEVYKNPFFRIFQFQLLLVHYYQMLDYDNFQSTIENYSHFLETHPFLKTHEVSYGLDLMILQRQLTEKRHSDARRHLNKLVKKSSNHERFHLQGLQFELKLRNNNFQEAYDMLNMVYHSPYFGQLLEVERASWTIRSAYLQITAMAYHKQTDNPGFDLNKMHDFYEKCSKITKDKSGYNVQYLMIKVLLLWIKDAIDFESESNNLKVYYQRYLKKSHCERTKRFFNKLERLIRFGFDKHRFNYLTSQLIDDFEALHKYIDHNEIITYEQLWIVIGKLIEKKQASKRVL